MSLRIALLCGSLTLSWLAAGCGDSGFAGSGSKKVATSKAERPNGDVQNQDGKAGQTSDGRGAAGDGGGPAGGVGGNGNAGLSLEPPAGATPEQLAIGACLKQWGRHPFKADVYDNYREIFASISILGGGDSYAIEDSEASKGPSLIVVHAAVSALSDTKYLFMNPNGYYCMMVGVNVASDVEVVANCTAKLADASVKVDVLSNASSTAGVGVNVLSNVKVTRKKSPEAAPGC